MNRQAQAIRRAAAAAGELAAALEEMAESAGAAPAETPPRRARPKILITDIDRANAKKALRAKGARGV